MTGHKAVDFITASCCCSPHPAQHPLQPDLNTNEIFISERKGDPRRISQQRTDKAVL